jgi:hypothetical protein
MERLHCHCQGNQSARPGWEGLWVGFDTPLTYYLPSCPFLSQCDVYLFNFTFPLSSVPLYLPGSTLPRDRVLPLSSPSRVEAIFAHAPGGSEGSGVGGACLLHFLPGDALSLLISEPRDGWHYGQNERTGR